MLVSEMLQVFKKIYQEKQFFNVTEQEIKEKDWTNVLHNDLLHIFHVSLIQTMPVPFNSSMLKSVTHIKGNLN